MQPQCRAVGCLASETNTPTIHPSLIKSLGMNFCKIDKEELTIEKLHSKQAPGPIGKAANDQAKSSKTKPNKIEDKKDEAQSKKKPKN